MSADPNLLHDSGRSPVVDIVVLTLLFMLAGGGAYYYFSSFTPDYSLLADSGHGGASGAANGSVAVTSAGSSSSSMASSTSDGASQEYSEEEPQPITDRETKRQYGLPEQAPILQQSDVGILEQLKKLTALYDVVQWSESQDLARRFVVLIYNLAYGDVEHRYLPVKKLAQAFAVQGAGEQLRMNPESHDRYKEYTTAFASMDTERAVAIYRFFYPALRTAFAELGEPRKVLHLEVIKSIDHLLATPDFHGALFLTKAKTHYKFADPMLEQLSPAQKQLIRFGPDNRAMVISQLEHLKELLQTRH